MKAHPLFFFCALFLLLCPLVAAQEYVEVTLDATESVEATQEEDPPEETSEEVPQDSEENDTEAREETEAVPELFEEEEEIPEQPSIYEVTVRETEAFTLDINAIDPDGDPVQVRFAEPLSEDGYWLTTYEDAGLYETTAYLTDGEDTTEIPIILIVENVNRPLENVELLAEEESVFETESLLFKVTAQDADREELKLRWSVDDVPQDIQTISPTTGASYEHFILLETGYEDEGSHVLKIELSDEEDTIERFVPYEVYKTNRPPEVDFANTPQFVNEGEVFRSPIEAEDPDGDRIFFTYGAPLDTDGAWETTFDDAGVYEIPVSITDGEAELQYNVFLTVRDVNQPPVIEPLENVEIQETEQVRLRLSVSDYDEDPIELSAEGMPDGATFENGVFSYTPNYDVVSRKQQFVTIPLMFFASDGKDRVNVSVQLTVSHVNRPPVLETYSEWGNEATVKEGESLRFLPQYWDPDGDPVTITYSGWSDSSNRKVGYDEQGKHSVIITASDGQFAATQKIVVKVVDVNNPPQLKYVPTLHVREGTELQHPLTITDKDPITITLDGFPSQVAVKDGSLVWEPSSRVVEDVADDRGFFSKLRDAFIFWRPTGVHRQFTGTVTVTDILGLQTSQNVYINVYDRNDPPAIRGKSPVQQNVVLLPGDIVSFSVDAEDKDELSYEWDLGWFDTHEGSNTHTRKFSKAGEQEVHVTVSDGHHEYVHTWHVQVIPLEERNKPAPIEEVQEEAVAVSLQEKEPEEPPAPQRRVMTLPVN